MCNEKVRDQAKKRGVRHWQIASVMGIGENTLMRWLRLPLPAEKEARILEAIEEVAKGRE